MKYAQSPRLYRTLLGMIFVIALIVRVVFVYQWGHTPYGATPLLDAAAYDEWAKTIAAGQLLHDRAFYASPLYPYLLGAIYALVGHSFFAAGLFNALLGALTALLLSGVAYAAFGLEAAAITGILTAFDRSIIFYTAPIEKETLVLFLLTIFLCMAMRVLKTNGIRDAIFAGATLGISALARGNVVLFVPLILFLGFSKWRRRFLKSSIIFIVMFVLDVLPATIHNFIVSHDFVPINYDDGFNFYIGNSATANGTNGYPPEISTDPLKEEMGVTAEAREALKHEVSPSEISDYWRERAFGFIAEHPTQELHLIASKFIAFWNNADVFDSYDVNVFEHDTHTVVSAPLIPFWLISCLAIFGAASAWSSRRMEVKNLAAFALTYMVSVLLFYVTDRYRLPVIIFLLPLAGAAIPAAFNLLRCRIWSNLVIATGCATLLLYFVFRPVSMTSTADILGVDTLMRGVLVEEGQGNIATADRLLKVAIERYPTNGIFQYQYGHLLDIENNDIGALMAFDKARSLSPNYVLSYYEEAQIYQKRGNKTKAIEILREGLAKNLSDPFLQQALTEMIKE